MKKQKLLEKSEKKNSNVNSGRNNHTTTNNLAFSDQKKLSKLSMHGRSILSIPKRLSIRNLKNRSLFKDSPTERGLPRAYW